MRYLIGLVGAALLWSSIPGTASTVEQNQILTGSGLVCDTKEQAERFVSLMDNEDDVEKTLLAVNREAGEDNACVVATIGFIPGEKVAEVTKDGAIVHVIEIKVFAVATAMGLQPVEPKTYYSGVQSKEVSV